MDDPSDKAETAQMVINVAGATVAIILTLILAGTVLALIFVAVPDKNQNALLLLIGVLSTNITTIVAFYYGTSAGAKRSSDTINKLVTAAPPNGGPEPQQTVTVRAPADQTVNVEAAKPSNGQ